MARGVSGVEWLRALEGGSAGHRQVEWLDVLVYAEEEHGAGASRWLADEMGVSLRSAERYLAITKPGVAQSQQPSRRAQAEAAQRLQARIQRAVVNLFGMQLQVDPLFDAHRHHLLQIARSRTESKPIQRLQRAFGIT